MVADAYLSFETATWNIQILFFGLYADIDLLRRPSGKDIFLKPWLKCMNCHERF